jgi:hypothetical protein
MHANPPLALHQQRRVCSIREHTDSTTLFNLLTSDALLDRVDQLSPEHRERLFPPTETLSMFLAQALTADGSCQQIVNQAAVQRLIAGLPPCSTHTGAYCRARQRLPLEMIRTLACDLGGMIEAQVPKQWRWHSRRVLLVDGTTVTMPDTPANQAEFPQQRGQLPGLGFPICRIVGITCLASGALLNACIGRFKGKGSGERGLLRQIQNTFQPGDVVLGDAFYPTYFFVAAMQKKGVDVLMEQDGRRRRSTDFRRGKRLGERDHLIVIDRPKKCPDWMDETDYQAAPASIIVREFRAGGKTLVTTMTRPPKAELKSLYQRRWHVELDIRDLKDTMGMDVLSCKSPDMAKKEVWAYLLAYNLIRWVMAESALLADILPRQISFKHCVQIWAVWMYTSKPGAQQHLDVLFALVAQQRVGNRPGRIEPRAVKRRPKALPLLTKPRHQARQQVIDFGHPKKVK